MRKSYPAYLWQVISEPGEAMYRLSQDQPIGFAAFTAVLPGLLLCVVGGFMSKGDVTAQSMALTMAIRVGAPLAFMLIGAGMCHGLAKHIAGGEGAYRQMLVVYGFSYIVRGFEVFLVLSPRNANLLEFILYLWQGRSSSSA